MLDKLFAYTHVGLPDHIFSKLSLLLSENEYELLINEFNRLTKPCNLSVDTTDFATFPVSTVSYENNSFTLDKVSLDILKLSLKKFKGKYTIGVYNEVTDSKLYSKHLNVMKGSSEGLLTIPQIEPHVPYQTSVTRGRRRSLDINSEFKLEDFFYRSALVRSSHTLCILGAKYDSVIEPRFSIDTLKNNCSSELFNNNGSIVHTHHFWFNLSQELSSKTSSYVFKFKIDFLGEIRTYLAFAGQFSQSRELLNFISIGQYFGKLEVFKVSSYEFDEDEVVEIINSYQLQKSQHPGKITHAIYSTNISEELKNFVIPKVNKNHIHSLKRWLVNNTSTFFVSSLRENCERRDSERYLLNTEVKVNNGIIANFKASLLDYSELGAKIKLKAKPKTLSSTIRLKIPTFLYKGISLRGIKYKVLDYNQRTGVCRLHVHNDSPVMRQKMKGLISINKDTLAPFSTEQIQKLQLCVLSELSLLGFPGHNSFLSKNSSIGTSFIKGISTGEDSSVNISCSKEKTLNIGALITDNNRSVVASDLFESIDEKLSFSRTVWAKTTANKDFCTFLGCNNYIDRIGYSKKIFKNPLHKAITITSTLVGGNHKDILSSFVETKNIDVDNVLLHPVIGSLDKLHVISISDKTDLYAILGKAHIFMKIQDIEKKRA